MRISALRRSSAGLALGVTLFASVSAQAAMDPKQAADALVAAADAAFGTSAPAGEYKASYDSAAMAGPDIKISGFKVKTKTLGYSLTIPAITLVNAAPRDKGGFTADRVSYDGGTAVSKDSTVTWKTASAEKAIVPSPAEVKSRMTPVSKVSMTGINVVRKGVAKPIDIASVNVALGNFDKGIAHDAQIAVDGINVPEEDAQLDREILAMLKAPNQKSFVIGIRIDTGYDAAKDTLAFRELSVNIADLGKVTFKTTISGVPLSKALGSDDPGTSGLALLAAAMLNNASLRFENAGVVERALDARAKESGMSRKDLATQLSSLLPLGLSMVGLTNEAFQNKLVKASSTFLNEPKNITLSFAPSAPVPFTQVFSTATSTPDKLPDVLSADVVANK